LQKDDLVIIMRRRSLLPRGRSSYITCFEYYLSEFYISSR
jgi:hypothetical protein